MEATFTTEAIVLRRCDRGEYDSWVTLYTESRGKLELLARGAKRIRSKMAGHLEPLCWTDIMGVRGKQYDYIGSAVCRSCFSGIKGDLQKLSACGRALSIFNALVKENLADRALYAVLHDFLVTMEDAPGERAEFMADVFMYKALHELGFKPEMRLCTRCR